MNVEMPNKRNTLHIAVPAKNLLTALTSSIFLRLFIFKIRIRNKNIKIKNNKTKNMKKS